MWHAAVEIAILSIAIFLVANLLPGIKLRTPGTAVVVAIVYALVDFFLFKILAFFSFPFILLSFGLFVLVINAALLWMTDQLVDGFKIRDFPTTLLAAFLISVVKWLLYWIF